MSLLFGTLMACATGAAANDRAEYNRRAADTYVALFKSLDRNADSTVTRVEAQGDLNFVPFFDDMDINRDGIVTADELRRYIEQRYEVRVESAQP
jgi:hypothetical protein